MATWPTTLPQTPLLEGFQDTPQDAVLRSEFDGYTKQRNRFTAVLHNVSESYLLTKQQYQTFKQFYRDTLQNGAVEFIKPDPIDDINRRYRFKEPYEADMMGLDIMVTLELEKLP